MDEYISKGNAIFAVSALPLTLDAETTQRAIEAVRHVPAADVAEVVRCKDCEYYVKPSRFGYCDRHSAGVRVTQRDYCSWGERKEAE